MSKIWFVTGASRGFGRQWTEAALERGDSVVATARNVDAIADLIDRYGDRVLTLPLDVTDHDAVFSTVAAAHAHFGRLDVIVNNAGFGQFGAVEELAEAELRRVIETNLFGSVWVSQAVVPYLREQGSGHIIQVASTGGVLSFPYVGAYNASKWGIEGITAALAGEVAPFGINVTLVEPDSFATDFGSVTAAFAEPHPAYDPLREQLGDFKTAISGGGDPAASARAILELVDMEEPPLRQLFGAKPLGYLQAEYAQRLATWESGQDLAVRAGGGF
ncbi:SDR family NAD(P)-dependent oxidoreductase [Tessaracoccus palaemonis]|uniref:SDR family NAD(P)-dependent oxidoreductase n=1 Tax=Tessaracoccus palaemonis TaxID=2829499 RepID=A0ABX8SJB8_9ACTN|nr:SDR family NAD(P)-dependent oxidoreductase [Tessaracoccus palaemonis]QXT63471.1 SDR family NAD(P)-dependent oxidoreductase [Tessaracoccus palaemonis]